MKLFQQPNIERTFSNYGDALNFISNYITSDEEDDGITESKNGQAISDFDTSYENIKYYESEDLKTKINITLYSSQNEYLVHVWITYKHPMINAAVEDNLDLFKEYFRDDQIKINLAFQLSLENKCQSIYNWLIENKPITNDPIYRAIANDNVEVLDLLLRSNYTMKSNWLIQAVENHATNIINEFLHNRKYEFESVNSSYFHSRVIKSDYPDLEHLIKFITEHYGYKNWR
jgi:hypothetical protein